MLNANTYSKWPAALKELFQFQLRQDIRCGGKVAISRGDLHQIFAGIGYGRRQQDLINRMDKTIGSLDIFHVANNHGIVVENHASIVAR